MENGVQSHKTSSRCQIFLQQIRSKSSSANFQRKCCKEGNEQKHLDFILDSGLSFDKHQNEKIIKAKKNIGIIKHLSKYLPAKTLNQMYNALVRSHLDYCDIIYHIPPNINPPPQLSIFEPLME